MAITIHRATTDNEREAVYRLRYDIYVEEMNLHNDIADHERRTLSDVDERHARLVYATDGDEIVGALRLDCGKDRAFSSESERKYDVDRFRPVISDAHMAIFMRFMVKKRYRGAR